MTTPADHLAIAARFRRARDAVRSGHAISPADAPWMVGFFNQILAGDRKEPHSIEDVFERLEHAAAQIERAAEQLFRLAEQKPGATSPMLALGKNELSSHDAATEIGVDQQTVRNWLHKNPSLGCFRDGRWIVFRDMLEKYKRARFPDAVDRKLSR